LSLTQGQFEFSEATLGWLFWTGSEAHFVGGALHAGYQIFEAWFGFVLFFVDGQLFHNDSLFFFIALFSGLDLAVIVEEFLGFVEFVTAGGLVAGEALDGFVLRVVPEHGVGAFVPDLGFDFG
jgi:hypothetical protein